MKDRKYTYIVVNKRLLVSVDPVFGVTVTEKEIPEKSKKNEEKVAKRRALEAKIPSMVNEHLPCLMDVVSKKAYKHLASVVKYLARSHMQNNVSVLAVASVDFDFDFVATFCFDKDDDEIAGYSVCSISDEYDRGTGRSIARKRLESAKAVSEYGKPGKMYNIAGTLSKDGINKIVGKVCHV